MADEQIPQNREIVTRAEAKRRGMKRFFTGHPCKHGHIGERETKSNQCCECKSVKFAEWYENNRENVSKRHKKWLKENKSKCREYNKTSYHRDIDKSRRKLRERRLANPKKFREFGRSDYNKHKAKRLATAKKRYENNPSKFQQEAKDWRKKNPEAAKDIARKWAKNNREKIQDWQAGRSRH